MDAVEMILDINENTSAIDKISSTLDGIINLENINTATILFFIIAGYAFSLIINGKSILMKGAGYVLFTTSLCGILLTVSQTFQNWVLSM